MKIELIGEVVGNRIPQDGQHKILSTIKYKPYSGYLDLTIEVSENFKLGDRIWITVCDNRDIPDPIDDRASAHILLKLRNILKVKEAESITETAERLMAKLVEKSSSSSTS